MFFIFSKILAFFITPIVWIISLLLFSAFSKNEKRKKRALVTSIVLLFLFSNSFIFDECMRAWEIQATPISQLDSNYEVGVVLGGMIRYDQQFDRLQFDRGSDRLLQAVELYKKGIIKKILFTGGSGSLLLPEAKEAFYAQRFLLTLGIPAQDIIIETESRNTRENALFTKRILDEKFPKTKILLITSAFHMRRAVGCFSKVGICLTPYSADRFSGPRKFAFDYLFIPGIDPFLGWNTLIHEITGYIIYKVAGYT
jgi:uncharacterized SAM-binding protein YcdF (DUF218 family)